MAGITKATPDPEGGEIERDVNGNPTGVLIETARYMAYPLATKKSVAQIKGMLKEAISIASSYGITTMHSDDFETFSDKDWRKVMQAYREMERDGELNARLCEQCLLPDVNRLREFIAEEVADSKDTDFVNIGCLKSLTDGSLGGRSAYLAAGYS